jgi:hypothetical protein
MHESDRNRLKKLQTALLLAASDLYQAAAAAQALDGEADDLALMLALETALVVCYARAFTTSSLLQLGDEYAPAAGTADAELHEYLMDRRHKAYAHTDKASGRRIKEEVLLETGDTTAVVVEWEEEWLPFPRDLIPRVTDLCWRQAERFRSEAALIQLQLDTESGDRFEGENG